MPSPPLESLLPEIQVTLHSSVLYALICLSGRSCQSSRTYPQACVSPPPPQPCLPSHGPTSPGRPQSPTGPLVLMEPPNCLLHSAVADLTTALKCSLPCHFPTDHVSCLPLGTLRTWPCHSSPPSPHPWPNWPLSGPFAQGGLSGLR